MFTLNLLLALIWTMLTGDITPASFLLGFVLGFVALSRATSVAAVRPTYFDKPRTIAGFAAFFLWELVRANVRVALEVLTPSMRIQPAIVAIPLDVRTDWGITVLGNLVTLTPGAFSLDVSPDRRVLYVHTMYAGDPDEFRRTIKEGFERRVIEVLR